MSELVSRVQRDIQQDAYYAQNFANGGERFLAWYLRNVLVRTPVQARDDITDGKDDKQIDSIVIDDEKRQVIVIQGKFLTASSVDHEPLQEVLAAWMHIQNLPLLQEGANQRLRVKLEAVAEALQDDYEVVFELLTTAPLTRAAQLDLRSFQETISEFEHPTASITLVDADTIKARWDEALSMALPRLTHTIRLKPGKFLSLNVAGFKTVLAAVKLSDVLRLPGVKDQTLFRKNVRQSLGLTNKVNKGLKQTLQSDNPHFFFLYHNGITAICDRMTLDAEGRALTLGGLSVVNGCQSINTIVACSEKVKEADESYVLFRFYEIPQADIADRISIYTNSQSAVKPRDLRSNDKRLVAVKTAYENVYRDGFLITKRGQERPADRDEAKTIDVAVLAKGIMSWHCQRPNIAYNENKLFDKYFEQLFKSDYSPVDIHALDQWMRKIDERWQAGSLGLNDALMAVPSYAKFHLLFGVQTCFCIASNQHDKVPAPSATAGALSDPDAIITLAANGYNAALDAAIAEYQEKGRVFSPQNWLKAKDSLNKVQASLRMYMGMITTMPGGAELRRRLVLDASKFSLRWSAD
jgi:AIPR protein